MLINLFDYSKHLLELGKTNSFTSFVLLHNDSHLSPDVCPHNINELLEFLIKKLFDYGC